MTSSRLHSHSYGGIGSSTGIFFVNPLPIPDYSDTETNSDSELLSTTDNEFFNNSMNSCANFNFRNNFRNNNFSTKKWNRTRSQSPIKNMNNNRKNNITINNNYMSYPSLQECCYTAEELLTMIQPNLRHTITPLLLPIRALQKREIIGKGINF